MLLDPMLMEVISMTMKAISMEEHLMLMEGFDGAQDEHHQLALFQYQGRCEVFVVNTH
jgi:hypothetical protein